MAEYLGERSWTFGGVSYQLEDTSVALFLRHGVLDSAEVRGEDIVVPSLIGQVERNRVSDHRILTAEGWVRGIAGNAFGTSERESFLGGMDFVRGGFSLTADPALVEVEMEDGSTRELYARATSIVINELIPSIFANVSIELLSVTPNWS